MAIWAFIAAGLIHREVEKRTVFVLFSKPVSRAAFIAGKFLGLGATLAVVVAGMGLFLFAVVWAIEGVPTWEDLQRAISGTALVPAPAVAERYLSGS